MSEAIEPFAPIETGRFILRCVRPQDAAETAAMMTPEVSRWVAYWPVPFTLEMAAERIARARAAASRGEGLPFAVQRKGGELLGWIMLNRVAGKPGHGAFGYWLGEAHHGQGIMREAGPAAVAAGFRLLDLEMIEAACQPDNAGSIAVLRRCGLVQVGEGMMAAPARNRDEWCLLFEARRDE
jgi:ribosomal-protein-alanine N-acetyltransferase